MIKCGQHAHRDHPPNVPMITGSYSKEKKQKDSGLGDVIAGAAVAIVKALKSSPERKENCLTTHTMGISPGKKVALSGQYLKQLETIQKLKDEGVLTLSEFEQQKQRIMTNLSSLS